MRYLGDGALSRQCLIPLGGASLQLPFKLGDRSRRLYQSCLAFRSHLRACRLSSCFTYARSNAAARQAITVRVIDITAFRIAVQGRTSRFHRRLANGSNRRILVIPGAPAKVGSPSVDAPLQARENVGVVAARGRMLSSVRPWMRHDDSRRPVWEFADRVQITRSVLEAQW